MTEVEKIKLLQTRICDLPEKVNGELQKCVRKVDRELRKKGITFRPEYYVGLGWGCVNKSASIELPFWHTSELLRDIHDEYNYVRVETYEEVQMGLRHEVGHAVNYAYELYEDLEWRKLFGNFDKAYRDYYLFNPWSKRHVRHLPRHYAQKHPDEDWAETFAVWLTPRSNWRSVYAKTPALEKLLYVDRKLSVLGKRETKNDKRDRDVPIGKARITVGEFYGIDFEEVANENILATYVKDLKTIFHRNGHARYARRDAWKFVHKYAPLVVDKVSLWVAEADRENIWKHLHRIEGVCKTYRLRIRPGDEEEKLIELAVLLTHNIMVDGKA